jgi:hypothetical protein
MPTTKDRVDHISELEELWAAPAVPEPVVQPRPPARRRSLPDVGGALVAAGWVAFFLGVLTFEPAPDPQATNPLWGDLVFAGLALALLAGASLGSRLPRLGFAAATVAGALGMVIAVACRTTGHHSSGWWLAELTATAALTALAAAGFASRLRRE